MASARVSGQTRSIACAQPNDRVLPPRAPASRPVAPADATALLILDPQLSTRLHWAVFAAADAGSGSTGSAVDLDLRGDVVALALNTGQRMVVAGGIPGTGSDPDASLVGYVVILPAVSVTSLA